MAVILALAAAGADVLLTEFPTSGIDREALDGLLTVLASSMLAVTTFALGIVVAAYASAASAATPRATDLVVGDEGTRTAIGSFIAAFIFAVVAKVALGIGYYEEAGRFVLFVATLAVLAFVVATLILWLRTLTKLGRLGDTMTRIERVTWDALRAHAHAPYMGAHAGTSSAPAGLHLLPREVGYLTHIDMAGLQSALEVCGGFCHVRVRPGAFVDTTTILAVVVGASVSHEALARLRKAFIIRGARSYDQDPRFGLIVLSEVAQRALSPAVNDPGTAILVATRMTKLLIDAQSARRDALASSELSAVPRFTRVSLVPLRDEDLVSDGFAPVARDGAGMLEVAVRLQKLLGMVAANATGTVAEEARRQASSALERSTAVLELPGERERLAAVHRRAFHTLSWPAAE